MPHMEPDSTFSDDEVVVVAQEGGLNDVAFVDAILEELENIPLPAPEDPVFMLPAQPAEVSYHLTIIFLIQNH